MRVPTLLASLLFATTLLAGCTDGGEPGVSATSSSSVGSAHTSSSHAAGEGMVHVVDNEFEDGDRTVSVGESIEYMNVGERSHTVTIHWTQEPAHVTRLNVTLPPGEHVTFTFDQAGTYHVWCRFHGTMTSGMASTVTVN